MERGANVYQIFDKIVEGVRPGSDKVIFTPWLYGERTPVENRYVRAAFFNQSSKTALIRWLRVVFKDWLKNAART